MPMFHALAARRAGSGHSVPVLVTDQGTIRDSTDILVWADSLRPGTLIPKVLAMQRDVLKLEDRFDLQLGPATRLWAYHCLLSKPRDLMNLAAAGTPAWQRSAFTAAYPLIISMMRKAMDINDLTAERAKRRIDEIFVGVSERLQAGRRYLVGDHFSAADLTFAALAAPVLLPSGHPAMPDMIDAFDRRSQTQIRIWRESAAGCFALRLYSTDRWRTGKSQQLAPRVEGR